MSHTFVINTHVVHTAVQLRNVGNFDLWNYLVSSWADHPAELNVYRTVAGHNERWTDAAWRLFCDFC